MTVKKFGLGLQNPVTSSDVKLRSLQCASTELIMAVMGERIFQTADHLQAVKEESSDGKKNGMM